MSIPRPTNASSHLRAVLSEDRPLPVIAPPAAIEPIAPLETAADFVAPRLPPRPGKGIRRQQEKVLTRAHAMEGHRRLHGFALGLTLQAHDLTHQAYVAGVSTMNARTQAIADAQTRAEVERFGAKQKSMLERHLTGGLETVVRRYAELVYDPLYEEEEPRGFFAKLFR